MLATLQNGGTVKKERVPPFYWISIREPRTLSSTARQGPMTPSMERLRVEGLRLDHRQSSA